MLAACTIRLVTICPHHVDTVQGNSPETIQYCTNHTGQRRSRRMSTATSEARLTQLRESPHSLYVWLSTADHNRVGAVYRHRDGTPADPRRGSAHMRLQLATAYGSLLTAEMYNQNFTRHGMTMVFWYAAAILCPTSPTQPGARRESMNRVRAVRHCQRAAKRQRPTEIANRLPPQVRSGTWIYL